MAKRLGPVGTCSTCGQEGDTNRGLMGPHRDSTGQACPYQGSISMEAQPTVPEPLGHRIHPAASIFPMMTEEALEDLANDIRKNGQIVPIERLSNGEIVDGRNRLAACRRAGVEPWFEFVEPVDVLAYVVSRNIARRHLTIGQRAMLAARLRPMFEAAAKERQTSSRAQPGQQVGALVRPPDPEPTGLFAGSLDVDDDSDEVEVAIRNQPVNMVVTDDEWALIETIHLVDKSNEKPPTVKTPLRTLSGGMWVPIARSYWYRTTRATMHRLVDPDDWRGEVRTLPTQGYGPGSPIKIGTGKSTKMMVVSNETALAQRGRWPDDLREERRTCECGVEVVTAQVADMMVPVNQAVIVLDAELVEGGPITLHMRAGPGIAGIVDGNDQTGVEGRRFRRHACKMTTAKHRGHPAIGGKASEQAAKAVDVSPRSVEHATRVVDKGVPELAAAVESGEVDLTTGATLAGLDKATQAAVLATADPAAIKAAAKGIKDKEKAARAEKETARRAKDTAQAELTAPPMDRVDLRCESAAAMLMRLDEGIASVIHCDGPWRTKDEGIRGGVQSRYETMEIDDVWNDVDVSAHVARPDGAWLLVWILGVLVEDWMLAKPFTSPWKYVTTLVWHKSDGPGTGHVTRNEHEVCLLYRTSGAKPFLTGGPRSCVPADRGEHSEKPQECLQAWLAGYSPPNGVIVDLYAGATASAARACMATGRRYVGAELAADRHKLAMERLSQKTPLFADGGGVNDEGQ